MNSQKMVYRSNPVTASILAILLMVLLAISGAGSRIAKAGDIAQIPLFLPPPVAPNIMFMQDDSGSMMFEILPDDYAYFDTSGPPYVFAPARSVYGSSDYSSNNSATTNNSGTNKNVATISSSSAYTALVRSSYWNTLYYNPAITYTPWAKADKTLYPAANLTCAPHNPYDTSKGCRNITSNISDSATWRNCSSTGSCSSTTTLPTTTFWTATYFRYDTTKGDTGKWTLSNYTKVEIKSTTTSYTGEGRTSRTDCASGTCTYAQEIQNFANWYTYYRSRILASRAGIGKAFGKQPVWTSDETSKMRVGFGTINSTGNSVDGQTTDAVIKGVRPFWGTNRDDFYTTLYSRAVPAQGTPLRYALDEAGQYYSRTDNNGPWSKTPGTTNTEFASCRQSFTILMTDGYWNGAAASVASGEVDNSSGPTITGPTASDGTTPSFQYSPTRAFNAAKPGYQGKPFASSYSDNLADIALYYWNHDLHGALANRVPTSTRDLAFWQHMVTFGVGLGVTGSINPDTAFNAIDTGATISWANPSTNAGKIDDLLHAGVNSRGGFFSAADPNTFANKLADVLDSINVRQESSATALATNSTSLKTDSLLYQAKFNNRGSDWTGEVLAYALDTNGNVSTTATWTTNATGKIPVHTIRTIFTAFSNASADKVSFNWSALSTTQQATLGTFGITQNVLNWLRGDQSMEKPNGEFRKRTDSSGNIRLLGDIINSDPTYVAAPPNFGYSALPGYTAFRTAKKNRTKMLYVGANDGMLHAFDALTGVEKFAFIPKASYLDPNPTSTNPKKLASLSGPDYEHKYFVDGPAYVADAYIGTGGATAADNWRSVLLGTMGAGGRSIFALDVTDPVNSSGTVTFGTSNILWEFTDTDLGYTFSKPTIGRLQDGTWVAIFGNGYGSSPNYDAYLYVVNLQTGALIAKIGTGTGTDGLGDATTPNGLSTPVLLGDANRNIIAAYAGDLKGNLWKFNLTGTLSNSTLPAFNAPLFKARDANGKVQPITAPPEIGKHPDSGYLIFFGTGKYFETTDKDPESTAGNTPQINSLYGIWDPQILKGTTWTGGSAITVTDRSVLQQQTIEGVAVASGKNWRVVSQNPIEWTGTNAKRGWYLDLSEQSAVKADNSQDLSERVIDAAILDGGRAIFTTRIQVKAADPCNPLSGTGWLMALDMVTGGRKDDVFDVNSSGTIDAQDQVTPPGGGGTATTLVSVSGFQSTVGMPGGAPTLLTKANGLITFYLPGQQAIATGDISGGDNGPSRLSWRQLR